MNVEMRVHALRPFITHLLVDMHQEKKTESVNIRTSMSPLKLPSLARLLVEDI
jgi:hypothetical protein